MLKEHKAIFKFFGFIRSDKNYKFYIGVCYFFQLCLIGILCIIEAMFSRNDLEKLSIVFEILFLALAISLKIAITYWHRDQFHFMFTFVEEHQNEVPDNYKELSRKTRKYFWILIGVSVNIYSLKPFLPLFQSGLPIDMTKITIYPIWIPFRTYDVIHIAILLWQFQVALFAALIMSVWDTFVSTLMIFIVGQLKYIQISVQSLSPTPDYKDKLIDIIHHHQKIIRYEQFVT